MNTANNLLKYLNTNLPQISKIYSENYADYENLLNRIKQLKEKFCESEITRRIDMMICKLRSSDKLRARQFRLLDDGSCVCVLSDCVKMNVQRDRFTFDNFCFHSLNFVLKDSVNSSKELDNIDDFGNNKNLDDINSTDINFKKNDKNALSKKNQKKQASKKNKNSNKGDEKTFIETTKGKNNFIPFDFQLSLKFPLNLIESSEELQKVFAKIDRSHPIFLKCYTHTYRTFSGYTCYLLLISRTETYLIDTISITKLYSDVFNCDVVKMVCCYKCLYFFVREFGDLNCFAVLNDRCKIFSDFRIRPFSRDLKCFIDNDVVENMYNLKSVFLTKDSNEIDNGTFVDEAEDNESVYQNNEKNEIASDIKNIFPIFRAINSIITQK
ncbi:hypothetical protein EDEG_01844 [Edhazardia aedis USNM 41457]|uniref:Uncharacterized protein n=1 Tax=Edhazardia aedis (strain USNM 41457) TaxID=1003232 RepID=J9DMN4_EDHAE|nr:hypothetical protein EDEG_01844 [Edhazardia aedis USNM 41457]|eukprot:EJW03845.1 hypothetical protein EDEG_01844 [Edhazardia aedis USNM 41457]